MTNTRININFFFKIITPVIFRVVRTVESVKNTRNCNDTMNGIRLFAANKFTRYPARIFVLADTG